MYQLYATMIMYLCIILLCCIFNQSVIKVMLCYVMLYIHAFAFPVPKEAPHKRFDWPSSIREKIFENGGHIHVYSPGAGAGRGRGQTTPWGQMFSLTHLFILVN